MEFSACGSFANYCLLVVDLTYYYAMECAQIYAIQ